MREVGQIMSDMTFIKHIESHLQPGEEVVCKICGRTAADICKHDRESNIIRIYFCEITRAPKMQEMGRVDLFPQALFVLEMHQNTEEVRSMLTRLSEDPAVKRVVITYDEPVEVKWPRES